MTIRRPLSSIRIATISLAALLLSPSLDLAQGSPSPADYTAQDASVPDPASADSAYNSAADPSSPVSLQHFSTVPAGDDGNLSDIKQLPASAYNPDPAGIPVSSVLVPTGENIEDLPASRTLPFRTTYSTPFEVGNLDAGAALGTRGPAFSLPYIRGGSEPSNADIKAGPLFLKFRYLDTLALYDDNYKYLHSDRRSEFLLLVRLNLEIIAQLTEDLQFAFSGSIIYLPLQNQFGLQADGYNNLGALLFLAPVLASQVVYNTVIAGWPVQFSDVFRVQSYLYSNSIRDNFSLFDQNTLQDQNGYYTLHNGSANPYSNSYTQQQNSSVVIFANTVSAYTNHLLPGDIRLSVRADHENLWYNQNNRGLPPGRDDFVATFVSERSNQRFKPYFIYDASYTEGTSSGITQLLAAGVFGPIDDQLFLRAQFGYYFNANNHNDYLYLVNLHHDAGPYTSEELAFARQLSIFNQEQRTTEYYAFNQILGPSLSSTLFIAHGEDLDLVDDNAPSTDSYYGGLRFYWTVGPKTTFELAGIYARQTTNQDTRAETITARAILTHFVTDTLTFQLLYQYQTSSSNNPLQSYYDDLVYLRVVKYF